LDDDGELHGRRSADVQPGVGSDEHVPRRVATLCSLASIRSELGCAVVVVGSPFPAGQYLVASEATAYTFIYFEGAYWIVEIGYFSSCQAYGNIP
jgi:hypothetical protein